MRDNPDLAKRLEEGTKQVRETKSILMRNAAEISEVYRAEIEEGTKKRQLLLSMGEKEGKDEATVLKEYGKFIPSKSTPIMNFIFFLLRDGEHTNWLEVHQKLNEELGHSKNETVQQVSSAVTEEELDQIFGMLVYEEEMYANVQEPQDMDKFIYGNMTHAMFTKIKKLKALSKSANENEAFIAYHLAIKLCKKYGLEFDKIPCIVE